MSTNLVDGVAASERLDPAGPPHRPSQWLTAAAGAGAAAAALGTGELLSGLSRSIPSLVRAVGDVVVEVTPGDIVRWSIRTFGTSEKTLLLIGVPTVAVLIGAWLGATAASRPRRVRAAFVAFGVLGGWAGARVPEASTVGAWASAAISVAVGLVVLRGSVGSSGAERTASAEAAAPTGRPSPGTVTGEGRRRLLLGTGAAALWAVSGAALGSGLRRRFAVEGARTELATRVGGSSPAPVSPADLTTFDGLPGISPLVTPNDRFYRIDTALFAPQIEPGSWRLRIHGMVDREVVLSLDDLLAMDREDHYVTLQCVSNEVGGDLVGNARWTGVPLARLLDMAGADPAATQIVGRSSDGWTAGFPAEVATDGRTALVAVAMNGEPLPVIHGFPARLVVAGLYGYVSATKWLTEIELTTWEAFDGYWIPRGWSKEGPIKTQSRIDVPRPGSTIDAGPTAIAGVAWAPDLGIERVEVRVDEGEWQEATLAGALSTDTWVQWRLDWDAPSGPHRIAVRATDASGTTQTEELAPPAPNGATGHHTIRVEVR